jgi:hypothetical protein
MDVLKQIKNEIPSPIVTMRKNFRKVLIR